MKNLALISCLTIFVFGSINSQQTIATNVTILSHTHFLDILGYYHIVGEIQNVGTEPLEFVRLTATFYNNTGAVVGTDFTYTLLDVVYPGRKTPFNLFLYDTEQSAKVSYYTLSVTCSTYDEVKLPALSILSYTDYVDAYGTKHVIGEAQNQGTNVTQYVQVIGTFYDPNDTVVGCDFTYTSPSDLATNQTAPFEIYFSYEDLVPLIDHYELTCESWEYVDVEPYVTLNISSTPGGYTIPGAGNYQYSMGFTAQTRAYANPGYTFHWELNGLSVGSMSPITLVMNDNATLWAVFQDQTPPVTVNDYDGSWQTADITINLTAIDSGSGVQETFYRVNGGPLENVSSNGMPYITTEDANNLLEYWSKDNAGNIESTKIKYVKIDKTSPTGSIQINANATNTNSTLVSIQFSIHDDTSGVAQARFSNDNTTWSAWQPFNMNIPWNLTDNEGEKTVYAQIRDQAGLVSSILTNSITVVPEFSPGLVFGILTGISTIFAFVCGKRRRARFKAI